MNQISKIIKLSLSLPVVFLWGCGSTLPGTKSGGKSLVEEAQSKSLSLLVLAAEDSTIKQDFPDTNFGFESELSADSLDDEDLLIKFEVPEASFSKVADAKLIFNKDSAASFEGSLVQVSNAWSEDNVTWTNAPALPNDGTSIAIVGETGKSVIEIDLTDIVTVAGTYSFRWSAKDGAKALVSSKDGDLTKLPKLLLGVETKSPIDATSPSRPANVRAQQIEGSIHVEISWLEASDVSGISHYEVYVNDSEQPSFISNKPQILLRTLEVLAESRVRVASVDAWGLKSDLTEPVVFTVADVNSLPNLENPGSLMATEGDSISLQAVATDRNGDTLTFSASNLPPGLSMNASTGLVTGALASGASVTSPFASQIVVSDGIGVATVGFSWVVSEENLAPELRNPGAQTSIENQAVTLQLEGQDSNNDTLTYSATNLPQGLTINTTTGLISGQITLGASSQSPFSARATVNDGSLSQSVDFLWTVSEQNTLPVLQTPVAQSHMEGSTVLLQIAASDANGDTLSFTASNLPAGLSIDANSGLIFGEIAVGASAMSPFASEVSVSDGSGSVSAQWSWTVAPANGLPVIQDPGVQSVVEGVPVSLQIVASDANGDTLAYSAANLPPGLSIDWSTGVISGSVSAGAVADSPYTSSIIVSDGSGNASLNLNWIVTMANVAPAVLSPGDQASTEGDAISIQIVASDTNGDTLVYSAVNLPTGLTIDGASGLVSGAIAPGAAASSPFSASISVSDGTEMTTVSFSWRVTMANLAPTLQDIEDQSSTEGDTISLQTVASDGNGDAITYSATNLPTGLSIGASTGLISGSLASGASAGSPYSSSVSVSDGTETTTKTFVWTVATANELPTIVDPGPQASVEGMAVSLQVVAADSDGDSLSYSAKGLPMGLSIDPTSGIVSGTVAAGTSLNSPLSVMIEVSDGAGASSVAIVWTVSVPATGP